MSWRRSCISWATSGSGSSSVDQLGEGLADLLADRHLGLGLLDLGEAVDEVVAQLGEGVELGGLGGELVVEVGQHLGLDLVDGDLEVQLLLGGLLGVVGVLGVEGELVAGGGAGELLVELGHDAAGADLVEVGAGHEPVEDLAVLAALDVDGDVVALGGGPLDDLELGELAADALDLVVDLFVGGDGRGDRRPARSS